VNTKTKIHRVKGKGKGKVQSLLSCYSTSYMETESRPEALLQSQKWQLIGMSWWYRSALCTHPVSASANNWTCGLQQADIPSPQSATL